MASVNPTNDDLELSIIVLSYNTSDLTIQTIKSISQYSSLNPTKYEIIVVDNNSKDDSVKKLHALTAQVPNLKVVESSENLGFSRGNNIGASRARGKILLFLNSDIIVKADSILKMLKFLQTNKEKVSFCGGKLFNIDNTPQASAGRFYTLPVVFAALFLKGDYWGLTRSSPNRTTKVDWVSGACLMTQKHTFEQLNGFDEKIFMYMDEIDLLYRAKKSGFATYFFHEAQFVHLGSASSQGNTYPILQVYKGFLYFYKKHCSDFSVLILRVMLQLKAYIAISIGNIKQSSYLKNTYAEALKISQMA